jgi:hypothetical protein
VGFTNDNGIGIWFLKAEDEEQRARIGMQTGTQPTFVIYTQDVEKLYRHVMREKVKIVETLQITEQAKFFHCLDLYGNQLTVVELPKDIAWQGNPFRY